MTTEEALLESVAHALWEQRRRHITALPEKYAPKIELDEWGDGTIPKLNGIMEEAAAAIAMVRALDPLRAEATAMAASIRTRLGQISNAFDRADGPSLGMSMALGKLSEAADSLDRTIQATAPKS